MSAIKVNYFEPIENKRTSTTINRNIAFCFCMSLHFDDFVSCTNHDYFLSRSVQDFINANSDFCKSKCTIERLLLSEIEAHAFSNGYKQALSRLHDTLHD